MDFDVAIIGGGINGCGCAADASLRGLKVILCEKDDLASKTSSSSTKLIHGGLRYLEFNDFSLVKKSLDERQTLIEIAPHLVSPLPFIIPLHKQMRPATLIRLGLFLYDHLSGRNQFPKSRKVTGAKTPYFDPLDSRFSKGFRYYDGYTDDARLTISSALQAREHGATILPRTTLIGAESEQGLWKLLLKNRSGEHFEIKAKAVINAAGPWVNEVNQLLDVRAAFQFTLVKGSHIIVPKLYEGKHAYLLQHTDKRIIFVIPYFNYSLIGTTEIPLSAPQDNPKASEEEIDYLIYLVNQYFQKKITKLSIVHSFSGIRPLISAENTPIKKISREYACHYQVAPAPIISIYGGKITTYRILAKEAVDKFRTVFPYLSPSITDKIPLPGSTLGKMDYYEYLHHAKSHYFWLNEEVLTHYLMTYGTRTELLLANKQTLSDLGLFFGSTLYQAEIDYLLEHEWAYTAEDILWRRTKFGLSFTETMQKQVQEYIESKRASMRNVQFSTRNAQEFY